MAEMNPVQKRLEQEKLRLTAWCAERSHAVTLLSAEGVAPVRYELRYQCDSVAMLLNDGRYVPAATQTVQFQLTTGYPFKQPTVTVTSKVVHPNIWTSGQVCLGNYWATQRTLDQLAEMMWRVLVWDHDVTNPDSAANGYAAQWYRTYGHLAPFDRLDPREPKREKPAPAEEQPPHQPRIVWS